MKGGVSSAPDAHDRGGVDPGLQLYRCRGRLGPLCDVLRQPGPTVGSATWAGTLAFPTAEVLTVGELTGDFSAERAAPFTPATLQPGEEWILFLRTRTADLSTMCANSVEGNGFGVGNVTLSWHWLTFSHEA